DGGTVRAVLVAEPDEPPGGERRRLGDANDFESQVSVHDVKSGGIRPTLTRCAPRERRVASAPFRGTGNTLGPKSRMKRGLSIVLGLSAAFAGAGCRDRSGSGSAPTGTDTAAASINTAAA